MSTIESGRNTDAPLAAPGRDLLDTWAKRREQGRHERRKYEPTWAICEHFLAGRQWVSWSPGGAGRGRVIEEPNPNRRERHTVNVIDQFVQTMVGKLYVEDLRPTLVFARDDQESEAFAQNARAVARFLWESECQAESHLYEVLISMLTYGTAALRCYFDSTKGRELGQFPIGPDGQPILDLEQARAYVAQAQMQGQQVPFRPIREGKIQWEVLSPHNILVPPGVTRENNFPWVIVERPMPVEWARMKWPETGAGLRAEDLASMEALGLQPDTPMFEQHGSPASPGKLRDHVLISTGYELPSANYPNGRTITWADKQNVLLEVVDALPYQLHSEPHHGIVFFHYHRLPHRFWSIGVVEPLIGPQRQKNRARSQMIEMKDRNLGRVYAKKGTITAQNKPVGKIMELIEVPLHAEFPQETQGIPPGPWIENEARINDEDMKSVAGMSDVSVGGTPTGVAAYSALALIAEQDERRVGPVLKRIRMSVADITVISLELARRYWQDDKQMAIAGPDGEMELFMYKRAYMPVEFYMDISRSAPLPTSPAVESQKIFDIFNAATSAGQPLPISWLKESLEAGRAQPLPKGQDEVQMGKAQMENTLIAQGQMMMPEYYDDDYLHIMVHRAAQVEAMANPQAQQMFEMHIQTHAMNAQMKRPTAAPGTQVPAMQGGHGVEAQNGAVTSQQGLAQTAAGDAPLQT